MQLPEQVIDVVEGKSPGALPRILLVRLRLFLIVEGADDENYILPCWRLVSMNTELESLMSSSLDNQDA